MKHTLQCIVAALHFGIAGAAFCQPLQRLPEPPESPLAPTTPSTAHRAPDATGAPGPVAAPGTRLSVNGATPPAASSATAPVVAQPNYYEGAYADRPDDERLAIWNSPEMMQARSWVLDHSRRSARSSLQEGEAYLAKLARLPPAEMRTWLKRFQLLQSRLAQQQAVERGGQQMMVEHALSRQESTLRAYSNINVWQSQAAQRAGQRLQEQQPVGSPKTRMAARFNTFDAQRTYFDPTWPIFDPASPRGDAKYWAAAASLPGDLPRSDPRNFIRGEEGIDFGESEPVVEQGIQPVAEVASAPPSGE